jgi:hypothetical protein
MMTLRRITIAVFILAVLFMIVSARPAQPALAGFTPTPRPPQQPTGSPEPPGKEPKDTPTPPGVNLTATPGLLPPAGGQAEEPAIRILLVAGMMILAAGGIAASRLARSEQ